MTKAAENSRIIIDNFRGNKDEFAMLKGVLCARNALSMKDEGSFNKLIDPMLIAQRMDEINSEAIEANRQKMAGRPVYKIMCEFECQSSIFNVQAGSEAAAMRCVASEFPNALKIYVHSKASSNAFIHYRA